MDCAICFEPISADAVQLSCHKTHQFHYDCILGWALTVARPNCPLCREPIADGVLNLDVTPRERFRVCAKIYASAIHGGMRLALDLYNNWVMWRNLGIMFTCANALMLKLVEQLPLPQPVVHVFDVRQPNAFYKALGFPVRILITRAILLGFGLGVPEWSWFVRAIEQRFLCIVLIYAVNYTPLLKLSQRESGFLKRSWKDLPIALYVSAGIAAISALVFTEYTMDCISESVYYLLS